MSQRMQLLPQSESNAHLGYSRMHVRKRRTIVCVCACLVALFLVFLFWRGGTPVRRRKTNVHAGAALLVPKDIKFFELGAEYSSVPHDRALPMDCDVELDYETGGLRARWLNGTAPTEAAMAMADLAKASLTDAENSILIICYSNPAASAAELKALGDSVHFIDRGTRLLHARNLPDFLHLLLTSQQSYVRLMVASVLAAGIHMNTNAFAKGRIYVLQHIVLVAAMRLKIETEMQVARRLVAIVSYAAELGVQPSFDVFVRADGFASLQALHNLNLKHDTFDFALAQRMVMLITQLLSLPSVSEEHKAMGLDQLNTILTKFSTDKSSPLDPVAISSLHPVCQFDLGSRHAVQEFCDQLMLAKSRNASVNASS